MISFIQVFKEPHVPVKRTPQMFLQMMCQSSLTLSFAEVLLFFHQHHPIALVAAGW